MTSADVSPASSNPDSIILVAWPKVVLLYPTFIAALIAAVAMSFVKNEAMAEAPAWPSVMFLFVAMLNLVVYAFDFPRTTSLTLFFLLAALVLGFLLIVQYQPNLVPNILQVLTKIRPVANATFYWCLSGILGGLYLAVLINIRFDYWEVRPNELLHHHGYLSNLERFSAPNLRISKEINDVFEYMLMGSGRLILHPSSEPRAFVLDNVLLINRREAEITKMLGAVQVQVRMEEPRRV